MRNTRAFSNVYCSRSYPARLRFNPKPIQNKATLADSAETFWIRLGTDPCPAWQSNDFAAPAGDTQSSSVCASARPP